MSSVQHSGIREGLAPTRLAIRAGGSGVNQHTVSTCGTHPTSSDVLHFGVAGIPVAHVGVIN